MQSNRSDRRRCNFIVIAECPLPTRWQISVGEPLATAHYGPEAAEDELTVFMLSEQLRAIIQERLTATVAARPALF